MDYLLTAKDGCVTRAQGDDPVLQVPFPIQAYSLLVGEAEGDSGRVVFALRLDRCHEGRYRRLGLLRFSDDDWLATAQETTVVIE